MHQVKAEPLSGLQHRAVFDVLGVRFGMESDSAQALAPFIQLLKCFQQSDSLSYDKALKLIVRGEKGDSTLECDGLGYRLAGGLQELLAHTYSLLLHWVFGQVDDYFLLHGSAVARGGEGLVISGQSGMGKTTLGGALAEREGWELLSDDVAPFALDGGALHPFPKALSLRTGVALPEQLAAGIDLPVLDEGVKKIVAPEALGLRVAKQAVRMNTLLFLEPPAVALAPQSPGLAVVVHRSVPGLLEAIRALPDVEGAQEVCGRRFVQYDVKTKVPARCLSRIESLCRQAGALVIGTARESQRAEPDFTREPLLESLSLDEAVRRFLRHLWGTAQFRLVTEFGGGAGLYVRIAKLLSGIRCLRLQPGRYEETLALLRTLEFSKSA